MAITAENTINQLDLVLKSLSSPIVETLSDNGINKTLSGASLSLANYKNLNFTGAMPFDVVNKGAEILESVLIRQKNRDLLRYSVTRDLCADILTSLESVQSRLFYTTKREVDEAKYIHALIKTLDAFGVRTPYGYRSNFCGRYSNPEGEARERNEAIAFATQNIEQFVREIFEIASTGNWPSDLYANYENKTRYDIFERLSRIRTLLETPA